MLGLQAETNAEWLIRVKNDAAALLADHAHCEKKAASMAISLLNRYPERKVLVDQMAELAIEEMSHFRMVLRKMEDRNIGLTRDPGDAYAQSLHTQIRKSEPNRLLDTLIVSSLIEARSCERFKLLSETVDDQDLREFYASLLASEARHRNTFLDLARMYFPASTVSERLSTLADFEARLVQSLPSQPMMHG